MKIKMQKLIKTKTYEIEKMLNSKYLKKLYLKIRK